MNLFQETDVLLFVDASISTNPGGIAAFAVTDKRGSVLKSGLLPRGIDTSNKAELAAILEGIKVATEHGATVVITDSKYAFEALTKYFPIWKANGWRKTDGKKVENRDLIEKVATALASSDVKLMFRPRNTMTGQKVADLVCRQIANEEAARLQA